MIAKLEFDTSEPEDRRSFMVHSHAIDMSIALWDTHIMFRNKLKYDEELTEEQYKVLEWANDEFNKILRENNIEFVLDG